MQMILKIGQSVRKCMQMLRVNKMHACLPVKNWSGRNSTPCATCFKNAKLI